MSVFLNAAGLPHKRHHELAPEIQRGIKSLTRVQQIEPTVVGTAKYRHAFFGDVDLMSVVRSGDLDGVARAIQDVVRKLPRDIYFSDFKCGGTKLRGRHWTRAQVLAGATGTLTLKQAIRARAITKLDVIVPVKTRHGARYVEVTNFLFIPGVSAPFGDFLAEMRRDINKYSKQGRKLKAIKRKLSALLWTDLKKDQAEIRRLFKFVKGEPGKLGTYLADCEVARILVKNKSLQKKQLKYLSRVLGETVTMRRLKGVETRLNKEINSLINAASKKSGGD